MPAYPSSVAAPRAHAFDVVGKFPSVANVNFNTSTLMSATDSFRQVVAQTDNGSVGNSITYRLPAPLSGGVWDVAMDLWKAPSYGDYTVEVSRDGVAWTTVAVAGGYAPISATRQVVVSQGVTIPGGVVYLRVRMATKNSSSTGYTGKFASISGVRVS